MIAIARMLRRRIVDVRSDVPGLHKTIGVASGHPGHGIYSEVPAVLARVSGNDRDAAAEQVGLTSGVCTGVGGGCWSYRLERTRAKNLVSQQQRTQRKNIRQVVTIKA